MTRLLKWLVGLALILGLIYVALVAVTGTKMREITEQQLATFSEQEPAVEAHIEWRETGFWRSSGVVNIDVEEAGLQLVHTINLRHGALHAGVSGEVNGVLNDFDINAQLFAEQPVTLEGRVGLRGLSLTYQVPSIEYHDTALGLDYATAPFAVDLVLREVDHHSQFTIDWIEMRMSFPGANSVERFEGVYMTAQTSLSDVDGKFDHGVTNMGFKAFSSRENNTQVSMIRDASIDTEVQRVQDEVRLQSRVAVADYDLYGVNGDLTVALHTTAMPFASFQAWQQNTGDIEAVSELLGDLREHGTQLVIDKFDLNLGEMGQLIAHGHIELRSDIDLTSTGGSLADYLQGEVTIEDLPMMLMMPMSSMVSGELPWTLALHNGIVTLNGEPLKLP